MNCCIHTRFFISFKQFLHFLKMEKIPNDIILLIAKNLENRDIKSLFIAFARNYCKNPEKFRNFSKQIRFKQTPNFFLKLLEISRRSKNFGIHLGFFQTRAGEFSFLRQKFPMNQSNLKFQQK